MHCVSRVMTMSRLMQVLEDLLLERNYYQVVYLGDGKGDYCPCTRLGPSDCILARHSYPDGSACALLKLLADSGAPITISRQCLSTMGIALQGLPFGSRRQGPLWPMGKAAEHTEAGSKYRGEQPGVGIPKQDTGGFDSQGRTKRHKGDKAEQRKAHDDHVSRHSQAHDTDLGNSSTASIDDNRCEGGKDDTKHDATHCTEETQMPLPPLREKDGAAGTCRGFASVYSWTSALEVAKMLRALLHPVLK